MRKMNPTVFSTRKCSLSTRSRDLEGRGEERRDSFHKEEIYCLRIIKFKQGVIYARL